MHKFRTFENGPVLVPLYIHPPQQRKPLTDEQIIEIGVECGLVQEGYWSEASIEFARAIEAAHGSTEGDTMTMPPLPEPYLSARSSSFALGPNVFEALYTADQMRAYAAQAVAAERERARNHSEKQQPKQVPAWVNAEYSRPWDELFPKKDHPI